MEVANPFAALVELGEANAAQLVELRRAVAAIMAKLDEPKAVWESLDVAMASRHVGKKRLLQWVQAGELRHEFGPPGRGAHRPHLFHREDLDRLAPVRT